MSISRKKMETSIINLGEVKVLVENVDKTRETELFNFENRTSLTIEEIRSLRDQFKNKKLFSKIITNAEGSIFLNDILTKEEQIFKDARLLSIKQVAYFAVYYKNQLQQKDSFYRIVKNTDNSLFENWFNIHVKYNLLIKLEQFYLDTIHGLMDLDKNQTTIYETDIEKEQKDTIRWIERTFLNDFKTFLFIEWEKALATNSEFAEKITKKKETIIFSE